MQLVGILLLQLLAMTTGEVSTQDYQKYTGSALTGTILDKTTARSVMRCSSLCAQHGNTGESCHAARYNGETRACELMSRSSSGKERWLSDGEWKIYTNQIRPIGIVRGYGSDQLVSYLATDQVNWYRTWLRIRPVGIVLGYRSGQLVSYVATDQASWYRTWLQIRPIGIVLGYGSDQLVSWTEFWILYVCSDLHPRRIYDSEETLKQTAKGTGAMPIPTDTETILTGFNNQEENEEVVVNGEVRQRRTRNVARVAEDGTKWRPFWQRGHTTIEEMKEKYHEREKRNRKNMTGFYGKTKLSHSNLDVSSAGGARKKVKISKYASSQGLHRMPPIDVSSKNGGENINPARLSCTNSSLNLPNIDPQQEVIHEIKTRDNSAVTSGRTRSRNGHNARHDGNDNQSEQSESEADIYLSDEDPEVSRRNLDKAGDYIVEHDWILKGNLETEARKVAVLHNRVKIVLPDEDPLETIQSRMDEINMMVNPRAELGNYLETIDPAQKERIYARDRFKDAVFKIIRYLNEDKPDTSPEGVKHIKRSTGSGEEREILHKTSLGYDMRLSLITQTDYRTEEDVQRILRATKAFKDLFPAQLEEQLARVVAYEQYDGRRIIAHQGRDPQRFYFVLTGKLLKVREYRLLSGVVTREEGTIEKGYTTDQKEMAHNWPREQHLVSKGYVEVLVLDKDNFLDLLHTCKGPPIDFLHQDILLVKDSNRTPWLYVVKTGRVKVVRLQTVIDVQNDDKFGSQSTEELGCARPFSHANAMLGSLLKQRKMKAMNANVTLPELILHETNGEATHPNPGKLENIKEDPENVSSTGSAVTDKSKHLKTPHTPKLVITAPTLKPSSPKKGQPYSPNSRRSSVSFLPAISSNRRDGNSRRNSDIVPHGTYLTSDGAEIIKISKRFFLQHAKNNTMLKVETMQREYMSADEAKTVMYNKETWRQYKNVLLQRTNILLYRDCDNLFIVIIVFCCDIFVVFYLELLQFITILIIHNEF
ncbi:hypothetical protein MAR_023915 [Mya arenaria]|uniref:Cyclic nucleotide-binding domain-containing protein n=1 Tax=Mya arenaria TaxID=6604 RepID=A0ABY7DS59_MYAAR|nr:hypothetical protein MAR_023915 [Mya arenaria]